MCVDLDYFIELLTHQVWYKPGFIKQSKTQVLGSKTHDFHIFLGGLRKDFHYVLNNKTRVWVTSLVLDCQPWLNTAKNEGFHCDSVHTF